MAKTSYLQSHVDVQYGYGVNTSVRMTKHVNISGGAISAASISSGGSGYLVNDIVSVAGGTPGALKVTSVGGGGVVTGLIVNNAGGAYTSGVHGTGGGAGTGLTVNITATAITWNLAVYPFSITGIAANVTLQIGGTDYGVLGTGADGDGSYFTLGSIDLANDLVIVTPWYITGNYRYTRANGNTVTLTYTEDAAHDLYLGTFEDLAGLTTGQVTATLDGVSLGTFNLNTVNGAAQVLLKADVTADTHTVVITTAGLNYTTVLFVYFGSFILQEQIPESGGEYIHVGPDATLDQSANNYIGTTWAIVLGTVDFAYTVVSGEAVVFYPQLAAGGKVTVRVKTDPTSAIVGLYINGVFKQNIDLYADPGLIPAEITVLDTAAGDAIGSYKVELRHTGTKNASSTGFFFYFHSSVVYRTLTDNQALKLAADFIVQMSKIRNDGAIPDAHLGPYYNFEAQTTLACVGLLAAYKVLNDPAYLTAVKNFLLWWAGLLIQTPGVKFEDGYWEGAYKVNPTPPPTYVNGIPLTVNNLYKISSTRFSDSSQMLPAFLLWWYWKLSGDTATLATCLPKIRAGVDGLIANSYSDEGFTYGGWNFQFGQAIFIYHDGIKRYSAGGVLLETHNDADVFFTYSPSINWISFSSGGVLNNDLHYALTANDYAQFSLTLAQGDVLKWLTVTAYNGGIANIQVSTDGVSWSAAGTVDTYTADIIPQEKTIYTAPSAGLKYFRIVHSGTINPAGVAPIGWTQFLGQQTADQGDTVLGLAAMWLLTRAAKYARMAALTLKRLPERLWDSAHSRWTIGKYGKPGVLDTDTFYSFGQPYITWACLWSRLFTPKSYLSLALQSMEPYQDSQGGFRTPGYAATDPLYPDSANYVIGENQLAAPTSQAIYDKAKQFVKDGLVLITLGGVQVGPQAVSKRYGNYYYTVYSGMACLALSNVKNPIDEQLKFSQSGMVMR